MQVPSPVHEPSFIAQRMSLSDHATARSTVGTALRWSNPKLTLIRAIPDYHMMIYTLTHCSVSTRRRTVRHEGTVESDTDQ